MRAAAPRPLRSVRLRARGLPVVYPAVEKRAQLIPVDEDRVVADWLPGLLQEQEPGKWTDEIFRN